MSLIESVYNSESSVPLWNVRLRMGVSETVSFEFQIYIKLYRLTLAQKVKTPLSHIIQRAPVIYVYIMSHYQP